MNSLATIPPNLNNSWSSFIFFLHDLTITFQYIDWLRGLLIPIKYVFNFIVCCIFLGPNYLWCYANICHIYNF